MSPFANVFARVSKKRPNYMQNDLSNMLTYIVFFIHTVIQNFMFGFLNTLFKTIFN